MTTSTRPAGSTAGSSSGCRRSSISRPRCARHGLPPTAGNLRRLKAAGFSDVPARHPVRQDARPRSTALRRALGVRPVFKRIDTCAAEFASPTAYMYSTYAAPFAGAPADEAAPTGRDKIVILGGGPNRIGQGIEFDYCCCHACFALSEAGFETIMINCNPETVSTDYDTSDRLYFEPLTAEDVLEILETEQAGRHAQGRHRPVRRPDAAEARQGAGEGRHPDPRHVGRLDRSRRGPRPLQAAARPARPQAARERHRLFGRAVAHGGGQARPAARGAALLCARRPRHGDHPRPGHASTITCSARCPASSRPT